MPCRGALIGVPEQCRRVRERGAPGDLGRHRPAEVVRCDVDADALLRRAELIADPTRRPWRAIRGREDQAVRATIKAEVQRRSDRRLDEFRQRDRPPRGVRLGLALTHQPAVGPHDSSRHGERRDLRV